MKLTLDKSLSSEWKIYLREAEARLKFRKYDGVRPLRFIEELAANTKTSDYFFWMYLFEYHRDITQIVLAQSHLGLTNQLFPYTLGDAWCCNMKAQDFYFLSILKSVEQPSEEDKYQDFPPSWYTSTHYYCDFNSFYALYWQGDTAGYARFIARYPLYERLIGAHGNGESYSSAKEPLFICIDDALTRFLITPSTAGLKELGHYTLFLGLDRVWGNAAEFKSLLLQASEKYIDYLNMLAREGTRMASYYGMSLLPMWAFSLDKAHQAVVGHSCIPATPVFDFARRCLEELPLAPVSPAYALLETEYLARAGGSESDYVKRLSPALAHLKPLREYLPDSYFKKRHGSKVATILRQAIFSTIWN